MRTDISGLRRLALLCSASASCFVGSAAHSAAPTATSAPTAMELTEVIVTAQKRAENIQGVPISMVAVQGDKILKQDTNTIDAIQSYVPGLVVNNLNSGFSSYTYMRGSGTSQGNAGADPSIAYFVDEVYIGGKSGLQFDLLDIDHVEVLKGPQGSLFGRNAAGGAISIVTRGPSSTFAATSDTTVGNYSSFTERASVTGPLAGDDNLLFRAALAYKRRDGFVENLARNNDDVDKVNTISGRAQLKWIGSGGFALLTVEGLSARNGQGALFISTADQGGLLFPLTIQPRPGEDAEHRYYDVDGFQRQDSAGATGRVEWTTPLGQLTSITALRSSRFKDFQDEDGTAQNSLFLKHSEKDHTFSQELRLAGDEHARLKWVAGIYFYRGTTREVWNLVSGPSFPVPPFQNKFAIDDNRFTTKSYAAFGQLTYDVTSDLSLLLGGRYTRDEKDDTRAVRNFIALPPVIVSPYAVQVGKSWDAFTPTVSLNYRPNSDLLAYVSLRKGFKSGGFQSLLPNTPTQAATPFNPEKVTSYEAGLKSAWLEHRLIFNASVFRSEIRDQQIQRTTGPAIVIVDNAGRTRTDGVDLAVTAMPIDGLVLNAAATIQKAEIRQYQNVGGANFSGKRQLNSPDFSGAFSAEYGWNALGGRLSARGEYNYRSKYFFNAANTELPGTFQKAYGLGNASLTYAPDGRSWNVMAWVKNIGDERYFSTVGISPDAFTGGASALSGLGAPRTFGVTLHLETP
jgi:iron complex outermembrane receptor protein